MSRQPPYLAMDGVLIDRPQPGCVVGKFRDNISNTTKKEPQKMKTMSTSDAATYARLFVKNRAVANRYWARCMGQDAAMDDETVAMIKEFLSDKLSDKDHTKVCYMLDGDVEAQDTEPAPQFRRMPDGTVVEPRTAEDSKADFHRRYPDARRIKIDTSGLPVPARAPSYSAEGTESFFERFPDAKRIKIL